MNKTIAESSGAQLRAHGKLTSAKTHLGNKKVREVGDDSLATIHPVPNPMVEHEERKTSGGTAHATVPEIKSISFALSMKNPPDLLITALGQASHGPWTRVELVRREHLVPPADGIWDFDLVGARGNAVAVAPFMVSASYFWKNFPLGDSTCRGVRIHGSREGVLERLFTGGAGATEATLAEQENPTTVLQNGRPNGAVYARFLISLSSHNAVLFRAGIWELFVFFRDKGTRNEGPTGLLLRDGSLVGPGSETLSTALGMMRYYQIGDGAEAWDRQGWMFTDYTPRSWDFAHLSS